MTRIRAGQINSETATDGHVLTANGSGVAAWEAPTGGTASRGELLISDDPSTPLIFADLLQNEDEDDLVYSD